MQVENILDIYELRQDASKEEKHKRTDIQDMLDIKHDSRTMRRMKFPGFNITLSQDQYKKLFENIPLRHRKGRRKKMRRQRSRVKNRAPGYNPDGTLTKGTKITDGHLKLIQS